MSRFAAAIASAFRRYATWLVAISWKRFILLSVLLLIIAGVLSEIPPFTWPIMETAPKISRLHTPSGDVDITIDEQGVQIKRKRQEGAGAAESLGVPPSACVMIGDTAADLEAARRAGARGILVPNAATRPEEVAAAREVAGSLVEAVELALGSP